MAKKKHKPTQKLLPFEETKPVKRPRPASHVKAVEYQPTEEAVNAYNALHDWLVNPRTRKAETDLGWEALQAVEKALLDGRNGWIHRAEDALETLRLRNGKVEGDDIPPGGSKEGDFHQVLEDCLDALHERLARCR